MVKNALQMSDTNVPDLFERRTGDLGPLGQYADFGHGYFFFPTLEGELGPRMRFNGREVIMWSVNNYLGLGNHPEVRKVDADAAKEWGLAYPMGSRMMSGESDLHVKLEGQLAEFTRKESCLLLNFGYQGILSIVDAMVDRRDVLVYDKDCHACIYDGIRMHIGGRFAYEHNDIESLEQQLKKASVKAEASGGGIMVISEGVFGMRGQQGKLKEIVALKEKYNFRFLVDDAHGFGVLGKEGYGAGEHQGCQDGIDLYFGTFAKSMASIGAFVSGNKDIIKYLKYSMRSQIYAKSLPMPLVVGAIKRLEMLRTMPELREQLWNNVRKLQKGLREAGFDIGATGSCVTPVFMKGDLAEATEMVKDIRTNFGIFTSMVVYPVVPKGVVLLRLIPTAAHTDSEINETIAAFNAVREKLANGAYAATAPNMLAASTR
jgi:glycine C-acetyltransferase